MMPEDIVAFARGVLADLRAATKQHAAGDPLERTRLEAFSIGDLTVWYVQVREAVGHSPSLKEIGRRRFERVRGELGENAEEAWERYRVIVERALQQASRRTKRQG